MATIKLRDYLLALSSKGGAAGDSDKLTILDSSDGNAIKTILKSDLVDLDYLVSELQDDFLDQFGEGTFSGSAQVDHDSTTNFVTNEHIDHTSVSIIAGAGLTGGGDISSDRTINIVSDNNGIVVNADQIELDTDSSTFSGGVLTKMNIEQVVSGSSQISADQTDGWVGDVKTQLNSNTVISGSSQVILNDADKTLFDTADVAEGTNLYYTDARVLSKINTEGVISGSTFSSPSQGTLRATINGVNSDVDLGLQSGDNVSFVDGAFTGNLTINGNLNVLGDSAEIQVSELRIEDKLITVASGAADSATSDGSGLEIDGANKSLKWNHSTQQFVFDAKVSSSVGFKGEGGELTGIDTDQVTEAGNLYYTDARVKTKLNTEGVVSGSSQVTLTDTTFVDGTEFMVLRTDGAGNLSFDYSDRTQSEIRTTEAITKGDPLYVVGFNQGQNRIEVGIADASDPSKMPSFGLAYETVGSNQNSQMVNLGSLDDIDTQVTNDFQVGDTVYVAAGGGLTNVKPTGTNLIQNVGVVGRRNQNNGEILVSAIGRSNDVPNIQQGFVWVGGPSDVSYQLSTSSLLSGQGVISGSSQIDVTLATNYSSINQYTDSDNTSHLNSLGVVSGSSQIDVTQTTNYSSINQYTDSDNLSYLNSLLVVSKSAGGDLDVNGDITASSFFIDGNTRTTGVHFANGLQHDGDGGTGIYFATDIVELRTQNNPSLQVDSSGNTNVLFNLEVDGNLSIGTGSADYIIHAKGTGLTNRIRLEEGTTQNQLTLMDVVGVDSELAAFGFGGSTYIWDLYKSRALVLANSNLDGVSIVTANNDGSIIFGVGTSPTKANSERARVSAEGIHITGSLNIMDTSNPGSDYGSVVIEGRRDGSPNVLTLRAKDNGTPAAALPQDQGAVMRWQGFDGTDFANMGYILVAADGQAVADSDAPSYMAFGVSPDSSETPSEVMRLDSDGVLSLNDTSNDVFINNNGTAMEIDVNRHPETGVFSDTGKGHARISLIGDTGGSKIQFKTANAINTTATTIAEISSGSFSVLDNTIKVGNTSVSANGITIEKTGNHIFLRATTATAGEYWNFDVDSNNRLSIINDNNDGVYIDDAATSWTGTSDERLKTINYELTGSLENLEDIRAVNYSWVSGSTDKNFIGLIAQDVEQHYPEMISEDKFGYKGIRYTEMIPVLVSAIKEQQSIIDDLKSRIETLENS